MTHQNQRGRFLSLVLICAVIVGALAACTTSDDEGKKTPTPAASTATPAKLASPKAGGLTTPTKSAVTPLATTAAETVVPATLSAANGQSITDGLCVATIPDGWVDDGTGNGSTASNARYSLFGGRLSGDAAWQTGVDLVKKQAQAKPGATINDGDNFVRVDLADGRGFEYRAHFTDRYCDFSVTATRAIPPEERAFWDAIIASLAPVKS